jgi:hypothetical protein
MRNKILFLLGVLVIIITYFFVFRSFFTGEIFAFGDSPNFTVDLIKTYFSIPQIWRARGGPFGAILPGDLILSLIMFFYGALSKLFQFDNSLIVKILFLFPATLSALLGSYLLSGIFVKDKISRLISSFLYTFNTYFLLLIDGGQVGVSLGYGFSPFVFWIFLKTFESFSFKKFIISLVLFWILTNIEIRFAIIILITFAIYILIKATSEKTKDWSRRIIFLIPLILISLILNSFWLVPIFLNKVNLPNFFSELGITNLSHTLFLFQPQWPLNEFGHVFQPPFYFSFFPLILFFPIIFKKDKEILILSLSFLIFAFLAKGTTSPLGTIYDFLLRVPFAGAFRDSTKFFLPLVIFASILVGLANQILMEKFKKASFIFPIFLISYLLFLIYPALFGKLTGLLSWQREETEIYQNINKNIAASNDNFRYLFFPARPAYVSETYPAEILDANQLYKARPFATLIEGTYDKFYFLWDPLFPKLLDLTGVKEILFTPDLRKKTYTSKEIEERNQFLEKVSLQSFGKKITDYLFPAFERENVSPRIFSVKRVALVIGGDDIYRYIFKGSLRFDQFPIIFAEDGTWPIENLLKIKKDALAVVFYNKEAKDLVYRILAEKNIIDLESLRNSNWGKAVQTIDWRNEAYKVGLTTHDFDLGKGVVFSNIKGEKANYLFTIKKPGNKKFVLRGIGKSGKIRLSIDGKNISEISLRETDNFNYFILNEVSLAKGRHTLTIENLDGFSMINFIEYFDDQELKDAQDLAQQLLTTFPIIPMGKTFPDNFQKVEFSQDSPTKYQIKSFSGNWLIFTETYHSGWKLSKESPFPIFSFINGFYIGDFEGSAELYFQPQDLVILGLKITLISSVIIILVLVIVFLKRRKIERFIN